MTRKARLPRRRAPRNNANTEVGPLPVYARLLAQIWDEVQPLIGAVTLSALYDSAVRQVGIAHPAIAGIKISVDGIDQSSITEGLSAVDPREVKTAMSEMVRTLLALFESIAGPIILKQVLPKVMRAERELQPPAGGARRRP